MRIIKFFKLEKQVALIQKYTKILSILAPNLWIGKSLVDDNKLGAKIEGTLWFLTLLGRNVLYYIEEITSNQEK